MTPEEKAQMLKDGDRVKLKPITKINVWQFPTVAEEMKSYFGGYIIVNNLTPSEGIHSFDYIFDYHGYGWNMEWLEESNFCHLPQELFMIE